MFLSALIVDSDNSEEWKNQSDHQPILVLSSRVDGWYRSGSAAPWDPRTFIWHASDFQALQASVRCINNQRRVPHHLKATALACC
jgi:hypothetical protein